MYSQQVTVVNRTGLHALPASRLVRLANEFSCQLNITGGQRPADPKNLLRLLSAGICQGTIVTVSGVGEDEREAVDAICRYISSIRD